MVLVLALEREEPQEKKEGGKATQYQFLQHSNNVAVVYNTREERPTEDEIEAAVAATGAAAGPAATASFLVTRYDLLVDNSSGEPAKASLETLLADLTKAVSRRENTTIIERGVANSDDHERLLLSVLDTVKSTAEYAMQMVADEIAKEKQMQRLLQLENEAETYDDVGRDDALMGRGADDGDSSYYSGEGRDQILPISKKLQEQLRRLRKDHPYGGGSAQGGTAAAPPRSSSSSKKDKSAMRHKYILVSASTGDDLLPPCNDRSNLLPASFTVNPPFHRSGHGACVSAVRDRNNRSHSFQFAQQKRKSTLRLLAQLKNDDHSDDGDEPLRSNGWGKNVSLYHFNGETSLMAVPGVPRFDDLIKSFSVDFWIRTDNCPADGRRVLLQIAEAQREDAGQLFQLGLNWHEEMEEALHVFVRDSTNRVLEALIPVKATGLCSPTKDFHHVMLHVRSLDDGTMECVIDGTPVAIQLVQQEHPIAFNPWPHRLFIGGCLDEGNNPTMVLRGSLMELRFWSGGSSPKPIVRWPLMPCEDGKLPELTRTIPADHHETLLNLHQIAEDAPHSAPLFDRELVVNAGTLPLWGELMHNWRLEIRFRTDVSTRMMTLVGVTDQQFKMQEVGIVLNAEPVFSKDHFRFHEFNTTFYLVDAFGSCCSALLRGTDRQNVMDGEWHTIVWKCVDSESNKFTVKVDGVRQDLLYVTRQGPSRFVEMQNWVCVGGHNVRNWKVTRVLEGYISRFFLTVRGYPYATLRMSEGPGSHVLVDDSGHYNHGLLINPDTNVVRRNDVTWVPARDEPVEAEEEEHGHQDHVVYTNNVVSVAAVVFTCIFDADGTPHEAIYDIFQNVYLQPAPTPHAYAELKPMWGTWQALPEECFKPLETLTQLEESINTILKNAHSVPRGHSMAIVRVGDSHSTVIHLQEPELPPEAVYDTNMLKWHYPFTIEGVSGRRELMLNRMIGGLESVLLNDTMKPFITARLGPLNKLPSHASLLPQDLMQSLQSSGMPWFLAAVTHTLLLHTEHGSNLHIVHRLQPAMSFGRAASLCLFNSRLSDGAREKAAKVIQRNWKIVPAKLEAARREEVRKYRDRKVEEIRVFRMNPTVQAKQNRFALLITLHAPASDKVAPIPNDPAPGELGELLEKQGYEVERLANPSAAAFMKAVAQVDADRLNFIYISGYGGQMNVRQPPLLSLQALHLSIEEGAARAGIEAAAGSRFRALLLQCDTDAVEVASRKKKKKSAAAKKPAASGKKISAEELELQARQLEAIFRAAQMDIEQEEAFVRDEWTHDHEAEAHAISREIRQTIVATREFDKKYKSYASGGALTGIAAESEETSIDSGHQRNFIFPCESKSVAPFASLVLDVEDVVRHALHRQVSPIGLQTVIAIDLEPVTAHAKGYACLASSTGNTLRIPYKPQQRRLLSLALERALVGDFPAVPAASKYAVLTGGIETAEDQRDWKSFAAFVTSEMTVACTPARLRALHSEVDRELPFTAELVPIRTLALSAEARDRRLRDREAQKVTAVVTMGVGSTKVQADMFALFKVIFEGLPLTEIMFTNTLNVVFTESNKGIDGILLQHLSAEIEKCRPLDCPVPFTCTYSGEGAVIKFNVADASQRQSLMQWVTSLVVCSLSWQIAVNPIDGYRKLDVDYLEYVYTVKTSCHLRRYDALFQQSCTHPAPEPYIRFLGVELLNGK